jgi:hypothetical protein
MTSTARDRSCCTEEVHAGVQTRFRFARGRELCARLGDAPEYLQIMFWLATGSVIGGELPQAQEVTATLLDLAEARNDRPMLINAIRGLGMILLFMGNVVEARELTERAVEVFTASSEVEKLAARAAGPDARAAALALMQGQNSHWTGPSDTSGDVPNDVPGERRAPRRRRPARANGIDVTSVEGAATIPYAIPNLRVELATTEVGVPVLWWRSVGSTHTAYAVEAFIDEVAEAAGKDPVALRLELPREHPRHAGVLRFAAEKAGWDRPLPSGRFRGVTNPSRPMWRRSPRSPSTRAASRRSSASSAPSIVASRSTRT